MIDKEKLLSDFFGNNYHKPMVVAPEEFMVIQKNGIMDLETLLEFETLVSERISNGCFIIINDEQVNAFAMKKNDISVVAINAGSIKKIMYSANLMMLSDKILLGIGDMSACRENMIAEEYPITEDGDNVLLYISGDSTREAVGDMIANLAVRFMLYHEIGHHEEGHVKRLNDKYSLFCKEVSNDKERIELEEKKDGI